MQSHAGRAAGFASRFSRLTPRKIGCTALDSAFELAESALVSRRSATACNRRWASGRGRRIRAARFCHRSQPVYRLPRLHGCRARLKTTFPSGVFAPGSSTSNRVSFQRSSATSRCFGATSAHMLPVSLSARSTHCTSATTASSISIPRRVLAAKPACRGVPTMRSTSTRAPELPRSAISVRTGPKLA